MTLPKIETRLGRTNEGGSCAFCDRSYHAQNGHRVLASYIEKSTKVVEPFNLCDSCYRSNS
jgi:hypothetical protein